MHYFKGHHGTAECEAHRKIVESLEERLLGKNYDVIATNIRYKRGSLEGEIDVLAIRDHHYHFYEVKSGKAKTLKAQRQYDRFKETHPNIDVKGIYVGKAGVKRLK